MTSSRLLNASNVRFALAGAGGALLARRILRSPQMRFAGMSGTTIAGPGAAGWVTDFLNAAYYRRPIQDRRVGDLRLAFGILTTRWDRGGHRRLGAADVIAFHRAFGPDRFIDDDASPRGTLNADQLRAGAARLLGSWFPAAWDDPSRRAWGIAFAEPAAREAYLPEVRLEHAQLGGITPPQGDPGDQTWHTYPPVRLGDVDAAGRALDLVTRPETWPDYGTALGRFTPVRGGGLAGQTFEIEVMGEPVGPLPLVLRGYVTVTRLLTAGADLDGYCADLNDTFARYAPHDPDPLPDGATPQALVELTTHAGHFLGRARNRLLVFTSAQSEGGAPHRHHEDRENLPRKLGIPMSGGSAWVRAVGTWDPLDWHLDRLYRGPGRHAQHAFWGMGEAHESLLDQLAAACEAPA